MTLRRRHIPTIPLESVEEERLISPDNVIAEIVALEQTSEWQAAFAALPVKHQQVLELHFFAELELAELVLVIGIPLGTVKSRLHRALKALRAQSPTNPLKRESLERMA